MTNNTSVIAMASCLSCKEVYEVLIPDNHICGQTELDFTISVEKTILKAEADERPIPVAKKRSVFFAKGNLKYIDGALGQIQSGYAKSYIRQPKLSDFIGTDYEGMLVSEGKKRFIVTNEDGTKQVIPFVREDGRRIIDLLMVSLPGAFKQFKDSAEYKTMLDMNLSGYLTAKAKKSGRKARENFIIPAIEMEDVWLLCDNKVVDRLHDISLVDLENKYYEEREVDGELKFAPRENVELAAAKNTDLKKVGTINSVWRRQTGSLDYRKFAKALGKSAQEVQVAKKYKNGGYVQEVLEKVKAVVLDELCFFDGGGKPFPFEERNKAVLSSVFSQCSVIHSENGQFEKGADMSGIERFKVYTANTKSPSQDRNSAANAYDSVKSVVTFFYGSGMLEMTFAKEAKVDGEKTGYFIEDMGKSYKRYNVGGANGVAPETGWLSKFSSGHKVKRIKAGEGFVHGDIKPEYYIVTAADGDTLTIAVIDDFYSYITKEHGFLINVLNEEKAYQGPEVFNYWDDPVAKEKILKRNCTDGGGMHSSKVDSELRAAGVLNSFDAHQVRPIVATKGATRVDDPVCNFLQADIVLTDGMVKPERLLEDLQKHGYQHFVVGQRKDGEDGVQLASQASQNFRLSEEELKRAVDETVAHAKKAIDSKSASEILAWLNAGDEEKDTEFSVTQFLRLAKERKEVMDEQWILNEVKSLVVKELNKLLNAKMFVERARNRYMFTDPVAIYRALIAGRYEIRPEDACLKPFEVVCPSKKEDGTFFMEEGEGTAIRFPNGVLHEDPVVTAVAPPEYQEYIEQGLWQGCVFMDALSWIVAMMSGADHDGDTAEVLFKKFLVEAVKRAKQQKFAGLPVLPQIDAYVAKDEEGNVIEFGTGCPTYVPEGKAAKEEPVWEQRGKFYVKGKEVMFDPKDFTGQYAEVTRREYLELRAEIAQKITVSNIEQSLIGVIANRIMILNDLLSRTVLLPEERLLVEIDALDLCNAGKWEIDRPKHGGAYAEMPLIKKLFSNFSAIHFDEEQLQWNDKKKYEFLAEEKRHYRHIFEPIKDWSAKDKPIIGFKVTKPAWLAAQKDERGQYNADSTYEKVFGSLRRTDIPRSYAQQKIEELCVEFKKGHNNSQENNIRLLIIENMQVDPNSQEMQSLKAAAANVYQAYNTVEKQRRESFNTWREFHIEELKKKGLLRGKSVFMMTKAKLDAMLRKQWPEEFEGFSDGREVLKALLRKGLYKTAKLMQRDPRALVGAFYLHVGEQKTKGSAVWKPDGREYRFGATNGNIHLPFDVFAEEMYSLISGPISKTPFTTQDLTFTLVKGTLIPSTDGVRVRVTKPDAKFANKNFYRFEGLRVAVRKEQQPDGLRTVMNFLNKNAVVNDLSEVTIDHVAFRGIPRQEFAEGIYEVQVERIQFDGTGETAIIYFE